MERQAVATSALGKEGEAWKILQFHNSSRRLRVVMRVIPERFRSVLCSFGMRYTRKQGRWQMRLAKLAVLVVLTFGSAVLTSSEAGAWHFGAPHSGGHHRDEELIERRGHGGRGVFEEDHHRPRRHRHCRKVEFHDHHGRHRVQVVCD